jgi:hypothetical protein
MNGKYPPAEWLIHFSADFIVMRRYRMEYLLVLLSQSDIVEES